ncbi:hypothetical protein JHW43_007644 [Diplocarpon mali]|nr:hypothetical protein JHW43_007644 [Diplocarpon mali]
MDYRPCFCISSGQLSGFHHILTSHPTCRLQLIRPNNGFSPPNLQEHRTSQDLRPPPSFQNTKLPALEDSQVPCKIDYFSNDTGLRNIIQSTVTPARFYVPTVPLGSPMRSGLIGTALESLSPTYNLGATGSMCSSAMLMSCDSLRALIDFSEKHCGLQILLEAVQIAVKLLGARRVVGIAGFDIKCQWVRELGAHACVSNYNSPTFEADLVAATPDEVGLYFDNVGGYVLDVPMLLKNWFALVSGRFATQGFIMLNYIATVPEILGELITALADGRIVLGEGEAIVEAKIELQPEVWMRLFSGADTGKLITRLIR